MLMIDRNKRDIEDIDSPLTCKSNNNNNNPQSAAESERNFVGHVV